MIDVDSAIIDLFSYGNNITISVWGVRRMRLMDRDFIALEEDLIKAYYEHYNN